MNPLSKPLLDPRAKWCPTGDSNPAVAPCESAASTLPARRATDMEVIGVEPTAPSLQGPVAASDMHPRTKKWT